MILNLNPLDYSIDFKERSKQLYDYFFTICWTPYQNGSIGPVAAAHFKTIDVTRPIVESIIEGNRHLKEFNIIYWYGVLFQLKKW